MRTKPLKQMVLNLSGVTQERNDKFTSDGKGKLIFYLKETEYHWNTKSANGNVYKELLNNFRQKPL